MYRYGSLFPANQKQMRVKIEGTLLPAWLSESLYETKDEMVMSFHFMLLRSVDGKLYGEGPVEHYLHRKQWVLL